MDHVVSKVQENRLLARLDVLGPPEREEYAITGADSAETMGCIEQPYHVAIEGLTLFDVIGSYWRMLQFNDYVIVAENIGPMRSNCYFDKVGQYQILPGEVPRSNRLGPSVAVVAALVRPVMNLDSTAFGDDVALARRAYSPTARERLTSGSIDKR